MRVRISYGVDIEKVPEKIQDLIYDSIESLEKSLKSLNRVCEDLGDPEENAEQALKKLDNIRQELSKTDLTISDCHSMIGGLVGYYKNGEKNVPDGRPTVDTSGDAADETENIRE